MIFAFILLYILTISIALILITAIQRLEARIFKLESYLLDRIGKELPTNE